MLTDTRHILHQCMSSRKRCVEGYSARSLQIKRDPCLEVQSFPKSMLNHHNLEILEKAQGQDNSVLTNL